MQLPSMAVAVLFQASDEPTLWQNVLSSLPSDPASLFTLALLVGVTVLVVVAGRKGGGTGKA